MRQHRQELVFQPAGPLNVCPCHLLAHAQLFACVFDSLALSDISDGCEDQETICRLNSVETGFDRDLRAVLVQDVQVAFDSRARPLVAFAEPRRYEPIHRLAQDLLPCITEQMLGLLVRQHDGAVLVHDEHRGWYGLDGQPESLVRVLAFRDVRTHTNHSVRLFSLVEEQLAPSFDPPYAAIRSDDPILDLVIPTLLDGLPDCREDVVTIGRIDLVTEGVERPGKGSRRIAVDGFEARRPFHHAGSHRVLPRTHTAG